MTDGAQGDQGEGGTPPPPTDNDDRIREIIREEIASALGAAPGDGKPPAGEPPESGTAKADEEAMRLMVEEAMKPLRESIEDAAGKLAAATKAAGEGKATPPPAKPAPEPTPESPQSFWKGARKALWGSE